MISLMLFLHLLNLNGGRQSWLRCNTVTGPRNNVKAIQLGIMCVREDYFGVNVTIKQYI